MMINKFNQKNGQTALSLVLLIGGVIVIVGITLAFLVFNFIYSSYGSRDVNKAAQLALAGVQDAALRINRNKELSNGGCASTYNPNLSTEGTLEIRIAPPTSTSPVCINDYYSVDKNQFVIRSEATIAGKAYVLFGVLSVDKYSSKVEVVSLKIGDVKTECSDPVIGTCLCVGSCIHL
ncbi:MAG: hypothetical protein WCX12_03115 [Candidatus Paceibacterota bacterium]|jgi:type II secretory pathway pseudopilin PulG